MNTRKNLLSDAFTIIIRNPVINGFPRLRGQDLSTRLIVTVSLVMSLLTAFAMGFSSTLRGMSDLRVASSSGAAIYVPTVALFLVPLLVSTALGVVLSGATAAPKWIALPVISLYCLIQAALSRLCHDVEPSSSTWIIVLLLLVVVVLVFDLARRAILPFTLASSLLILMATVSMAVVMRSLSLLSELTGARVDVAVVQVILQAVALFCFPMVFVAGLDATKFSIVAADWAADRVSQVQRRYLVTGIAIIVYAVGGSIAFSRLVDNVDKFGTRSLLESASAAALLVALWRINRTSSHVESDSEAVRSAQSLAIRLSTFIVLMPMVVQILVLLKITLGPTHKVSTSLLQPAMELVLRDSLPFVLRGLLGLGLLVIGFRNPARPLARAAMIMTGGVLVANNFGELVTGAPIVVGGEHLDLLVIVFSAALLGVSALRRRLTVSLVAALAGLVVLTSLTAQNTFASGPLAVLLPLGGLGLLVFGLLWGALTGAGDANKSSPTFGSAARLILFSGYQLLTMSIVFWAIMLRDPRLTNEFASATSLGVRTVGVGLLSAIIVRHARAFARPQSDEA